VNWCGHGQEVIPVARPHGLVELVPVLGGGDLNEEIVGVPRRPSGVARVSDNLPAQASSPILPHHTR